ncbi:FAST kinase domain-containing protein 1, mitochondrial-like [Rana temporaria]|uniref:FAST kinase domain-containing protein 1, mitochondrial-like n=1 Tax=Rana temporaria TaxID=8407 RepID=UPI001AAD95BD|nr:FAST kinase domain-containing protein 1, mitochondrial-like [Rana temporaria]XP_040213733.1 FAST kinase domain-containing protein 1, mitochondrial-like [Rana temporaria]XP_040213734.1 FAST kinase domain-containing protein 1, mitochondrial-like [Rana temporaria]
MFRCSRTLQFSLRFIQTRSKSSDALLEQLKHCTHESQLFQLVAFNKPLLSVNHVSFAIRLLWQIQKEKNGRRNLEEIQSHPEFIALRGLAENKVRCMKDKDLVDTLYSAVRLGMKGHHTLAQQLVVEVWKRLESLDFCSLSKFSVCLVKHGMYSSPLLGQIASIVDKKLNDLQDLRILSILMIRLQPVCSTSLQHRLITKAHSLMGEEEPVSVNTLERIVRFAEGMDSFKPSIKEKCFGIIVQQMKQANLRSFCVLFELYQSLDIYHPEVLVMLKSRLLELSELDCNTQGFTRIFCILLPWTSQETRERLENSLLGLADDDELHYKRLLEILISMAVAKCRHPILIHKIFSLAMKKLDRYGSKHLCTMARTVVFLSCQNYNLFADLQRHLLCKLKTCVIINPIIKITSVLSLMSPGSVDKAILSKLDDIVLQCDLYQINQMANGVILWLLKTPPRRSYTKLYKKMNTYALEKIRNMENIDVLLKEMTNVVTGHWFQDVLVEATLETCQRLLPQVTYKNVLPLSRMITLSLTRCTPVLDKIAAETMGNVAEFSLQELYTILSPFSYLTYEPPNAEEFYDACIQQCLANLHSVRPYRVVMLAYILTLAERLPEGLVKAIFNVDFLSRLDLELDVSKAETRMTVRRRLMEVNRALCIECPEYQIPWFHDQYCQQLQQTDGDYKNPILNQIRHLLGEALGGIHYTRMSIVTPYYYSVDFECILDKNKNPISYTDLNLPSADVSKLQSEIDGTMQEDEPLPPGAQRVAVNFLYPIEYCRNSLHPTGLTGMKKRHLEMLGYHVIQIPSTEWNSMELGTAERWINYLREKIFSDEF